MEQCFMEDRNTTKIPVQVLHVWVEVLMLSLACAYCLFSLFFYNRLLGRFVTLILRYFVLDKSQFFFVKSIYFSPLCCRFLFKGLVYQNKDLSLRAVDGYATLKLLRNPSTYRHLYPEMISKDLIHCNCLVNSGLKKEKGMIIAVDKEKKKVCVQLISSGDGDNFHHNFSEGSLIGLMKRYMGGAFYAKPRDDPNRSSDNDEDLSSESEQEETGSSFSPASSATIHLGRVPLNNNDLKMSENRPNIDLESQEYRFRDATDLDGGNNLHWYSATDVFLPITYSRCRLYLNGVRISVYNSTQKYQDLVSEASKLAGMQNAKPETPEGAQKPASVSVLNRFKHQIIEAIRSSLSEKHSNTSERAAAEALQAQQLQSRSRIQRFFSFVRAVEFDFSLMSISIGGAKSSFPFMLHFSCSRFTASASLTKPSNPIDLYRLVTDCSVENVDLRITPMRAEQQEIIHPSKSGRKGKGWKPSSIMEDFSLVIDGKTGNELHFRHYTDKPNFYAGEEVSRETLPRQGLEVYLNIPKIRAGPWVELCRMHLTEFFFPRNFSPLTPLDFRIGFRRPCAPVEVVLTLGKHTKVEMPFQRMTPTIQPPFGICGVSEQGFLSIMLGDGTEIIYKTPFLLEGEKQQKLQVLFSGCGVEVVTNAVLGLPSVLAKVDLLQCYLDRVEEKIWNECKSWDIALVLSKGMCNFSMDYIPFFIDLLNDWQYAGSTYLNVPLTTETFNTEQRFIREFVPQIRKLEVIMASGMDVNINANHQHVIYGSDPFGRETNMLVKFHVGKGHLEVDFSADQYLLSSRNEVSRRFKAFTENTLVYLSVPPTHPCYHNVSTEKPFVTIQSFDVDVTHATEMPCQSVPQEPFPTQLFRSHLDVQVMLRVVRGELEGAHIKAVWGFLDNLFIGHTMSIMPQELFWLFTLLQSKVGFGMNKKQEWFRFLESQFTKPKLLVISISVALRDVEAKITKPVVDTVLIWRTPEFTFTYLKDTSMMEICVSLTPVTCRWVPRPPPDLHGGTDRTEERDSYDELSSCRIERGENPARRPGVTWTGSKNLKQFRFPPSPSPSPSDAPGETDGSPVGSFLSVGSMVINLTKHFGPLPERAKMQELMSVKVDGIVFDMCGTHLLHLVELGMSVYKDLLCEDKALEEAILRARLNAEQNMRGNVENEDNLGPGSALSIPLSSLAPQREGSFHTRGTDWTTVVKADAEEADGFISSVQMSFKSGQDAGGESDEFTAPHQQALSPPYSSRLKKILLIAPNALSYDLEGVPIQLAKGFERSIAMEENAEQTFKEYGLSFVHLDIPRVSGAIRCAASELFWVHFPTGLQLHSSTLNTAFFTSKMVLCVDQIHLHGLRSARAVCQLDGSCAGLRGSSPTPTHHEGKAAEEDPFDLLHNFDPHLTGEGSGRGRRAPTERRCHIQIPEDDQRESVSRTLPPQRESAERFPLDLLTSSPQENPVMIEVCHLRTGVQIEYKTESSIHGALQLHMMKQQDFIAALNHKQFIPANLWDVPKHGAVTSRQSISSPKSTLHADPVSGVERKPSSPFSGSNQRFPISNSPLIEFSRHPLGIPSPAGSQQHSQLPSPCQREGQIEMGGVDRTTKPSMPAVSPPVSSRNTPSPPHETPPMLLSLANEGTTLSSEDGHRQGPSPSSIESMDSKGDSLNVSDRLLSIVSCNTHTEQHRSPTPPESSMNRTRDRFPPPGHSSTSFRSLEDDLTETRTEQLSSKQFHTCFSHTSFRSTPETEDVFSCQSRELTSTRDGTAPISGAQPHPDDELSSSLTPLSGVKGTWEDGKEEDSLKEDSASSHSETFESSDMSTSCSHPTSASDNDSTVNSLEGTYSFTEPPRGDATRSKENYWRYYSFFVFENDPHVSCLAYDPYRPVSNCAGADRTMYAPKLPHVHFRNVAPAEALQEVFVPLSNMSENAYDSPMSKDGLLSFGTHNTHDHVGNSSVQPGERRLSNTAGSHAPQALVRKHISIQFSSESSAFLASEVCPLLTEGVGYTEQCLSLLGGASGETSDTGRNIEFEKLPERFGKRKKASARVFYKTRKPIVLYFVEATLTRFRVDIVGRNPSPVSQRLRGALSASDTISSSDSFIRASLSLYGVNFALQTRPSARTNYSTFGTSQAQKLSMILSYSSMMGFTAMPEGSCETSILNIRVPNFQVLPVRGLTSMLSFSGGGAKGCVNMAPLHIALSPLSLGSISVDATRDYPDALLMLMSLVEKIQASIGRHRRTSKYAPPQSVNSSLTDSMVKSQDGIDEALSASLTSMTCPETFLQEKGRIQIEVKITLESIRLNLYDVVLQAPSKATNESFAHGGKRAGAPTPCWVINHDENACDIGPCFFNFAVKSESTFNYNRTTVHSLGHIDSFRVKLHPNVVSIVNFSRAVFNAKQLQKREQSVPLMRRQSIFANRPIKQLEKFVDHLEINLSCRFRRIEGLALQNEKNFMRFCIEEITVCHIGEQKVQRSVVHEIFDCTPTARKLLISLARRCRENYLNSNRVAPCLVSLRPDLRSTTTVMLTKITAAYHPNISLELEPVFPSSPSLVPPLPKKNKNVFNFSIQNILFAVPSSYASEFINQQYNVSLMVSQIVFELPHVPHFSDVVYPQLQRYVYDWRKAFSDTGKFKLHLLQTPASPESHASLSRESLSDEDEAKTRVPRGNALWMIIRLENIRLFVGLDKSTTQEFRIPGLVSFIEGSDQRWNLKAHLEPFTAFSISNDRRDYEVKLPNAYMSFRGDEKKVHVMGVVDKLKTNFTTAVLNHVTLLIKKFLEEIVPLFKPIPLELVGRQSYFAENASPLIPPSAGRSLRRPTVSVLFCGGRVSCLTPITTLWLTVRHAGAFGVSFPDGKSTKLTWMVSVEGAQIAVTDRAQQKIRVKAPIEDPSPSSTASVIGEVASPLPTPSEIRRPTAPSFDQRSMISRSTRTSMAELTDDWEIMGFVWGSFVFSCKISNRTSPTKVDTISNGSKQGGKGVLRSSYEWTVLLQHPVAILRFGFPQVLMHSFRRTKDEIEDVLKASERKERKSLARFQRSHQFRALRAQKKDIHQRIVEAAQRVREEAKVEASIYLGRTFGEREETYSLVKRTCTVSLVNFLLVVPVGDAAYRQMSETALHYNLSTGARKGKSNHLTAQSFKPGVFFPQFALKLQLRRAFCLLGIKSKQQIPLLAELSPPTTEMLSVNGRLIAQDIHFFCTDGSPVDISSSDVMERAMSETVVFGGKGILSSSNQLELLHSRNSFSIPSIDIPVNFRKDETVQFRMVIDVTSPVVHISPWIFSIVAALQKESVPKKLASALQNTEPAVSAARDGKNRSTSRWFSNTFSGTTSNWMDQSENGAVPSTSEAPSVPMVINISARVEKGTMKIFSHTYAPETNQGPQPSRIYKFDRARKSEAKRSEPDAGTKSCGTFASMSALDSGIAYCLDYNASSMASAPDVTLPAMMSQFCLRMEPGKEVSRIVAAEIMAQELKLTPDLFMISSELQHISSMYEVMTQHRTATVLKTVREVKLDKKISRMLRKNHCTLLDMVVPVPLACGIGLQTNKRRLRSARPTVHFTHSIFSQPISMVPNTTSVQLSIKNFNLSLGTEPIQSTSFSCFLTEQGSIDVVVNLQTTGEMLLPMRYPRKSVIFHVHRLRAECQTRLEVKSIEMHCPQLMLVLCGEETENSIIQTCTLNLPFNRETSEKNLILRLQHLSQAFIVRFLWMETVKDFIRAVRKSFGRTLAPEKSTSSTIQCLSPLLQNNLSTFLQGKGTDFLLGRLEKPKKSKVLVGVAAVSRGIFEVDCGSGNLHRLHSGSLKVGLQKSVGIDLTTTYFLKASLRDALIKSEGLLSGSLRVAEVLAMTYRIMHQNSGSGSYSNTQKRTFRLTIQTRGISCFYKERHVKDVLEWKADLLRLKACDGRGENESFLVDFALEIHRSKFRVTPNTIPGILNVVYSLSLSIHDRQQQSFEKVKSALQSKQLPGFIVNHLQWLIRSGVHVNQAEPSVSDVQNSPQSLPFDEPVIPFLGNQLFSVPCGQLQIVCTNTTFSLGAVAGEEMAMGSVVITLHYASVCFAECVVDKMIKKVLRMSCCDAEFYRPLPMKSLIMGLKGENVLEFYTCQKVGQNEVGYNLDLSQGFPWTGNPTYRDFAEIVELFRLFVESSDVKKLKKIMKEGENEEHGNWESREKLATSYTKLKELREEHFIPSPGDSLPQTDVLGMKAEEERERDPRAFKALRPAKFSPQLRFGGDIAVNTEVILNWFGVTKKVLPRAIHCAIGDKLEAVLDKLSRKVGENVEERDFLSA